MARTYEHDAIDVTYDARRCIHARRCVLRLPQAFVESGGRDWIDPAAASPDAIAGVVLQCPSGALTYRRKDHGPEESAPPVNTVQLTEDGPLRVEGDIRLQGEAIGYRATLCRCGHSRRKPFCDGSHAQAGFRATGQRQGDDRRDLPARDGPLTITPRANGPLRVEGNLELVAASGATFATRTAVSLCRCGHSRNKPFCDGAHTAAGFTADGA